MASSRCPPMLSAGCLLWWHPTPQSMTSGSVGVMGFCLKEAVSSDLWISLIRLQVMKCDLFLGNFSGIPWEHIAESLLQNRKVCNHWASAISSLDVSLTTALFLNWTWPGVSPADTLNSLYFYKRNGHTYCTVLERGVALGDWKWEEVAEVLSTEKGTQRWRDTYCPMKQAWLPLFPGLGLIV